MFAQSSLDVTFAALADPTRRAILARLAEGEATVGDLAAPFSISQPAISRHVRVLADAGLIVQRVDGARRPCRLAPRALHALDDYLDVLRRALEHNYERLDALLEEEAQRAAHAGLDAPTGSLPATGRRGGPTSRTSEPRSKPPRADARPRERRRR